MYTHVIFLWIKVHKSFRNLVCGVNHNKPYRFLLTAGNKIFKHIVFILEDIICTDGYTIYCVLCWASTSYLILLSCTFSLFFLISLSFQSKVFYTWFNIRSSLSYHISLPCQIPLSHQKYNAQVSIFLTAIIFRSRYYQV